MSIIDRIKAIMQSFRNRNVPKLEEGKTDNNPRHSHTSREEFVRKTREGISQTSRNPHRQFNNPQPVQLVQLNQDRRSHLKIKYDGTYHKRISAQRASNQPSIKLRIAAIASAAALAASCIAACTNIEYENMSLTQLQEYLSDINLPNEELPKISNALENDGLDILKGKVADALDINPEYKNDFIKVVAEDPNAPTTIITPSAEFRSTDGVVDEFRSDIMTAGPASVVNSIARLQDDNRPASRTELKHYIEQLKTLEESEITVTPNVYTGDVLSTDPAHEKLLIQYSIADDIQKDSNSHDANNDYEIGD